MIRLCTHCKKEDTLRKEFKYCAACFIKCIEWLEQKKLERPEPPSIVSPRDAARFRGGSNGREN